MLTKQNIRAVRNHCSTDNCLAERNTLSLEEVGRRVLVADDVPLAAGPSAAATSSATAPAGGRRDAEAALVADESSLAEASRHALRGADLGGRSAAHGGAGRAAAVEDLVALAATSASALVTALVPWYAGAVPRRTNQAWLAVALGSADALVERLSPAGSTGATARHQVALGAGGLAVGVALGVPHLGPGVARPWSFKLLSSG